MALLLAMLLFATPGVQARDGGRDSDHGSDHGSSDRGSDHGSGSDRHGGRDDSRDSRDRGSDAHGGRDSDDDSGTARDASRDQLRSDAATRSALLTIDVDRGVDGHERRQGEVLMIGSDAAVAAVRAAGYGVITEHRLKAFDEVLARVRLAPGESVERAISRIQALAPEASAAANHLFRPSQAIGSGAAPGSPALVAANRDSGARVGIIDTGADRQWPLLAGAVLDAQSFTGADYSPREHGSLVAAIGSANGARLAVADVFDSDAEHQLIAPADAIARAVDWLISERYPVINISIEGPDNEVLAHVIKRALAANVVLVAAAGNGGPAAAPAYPAAYPGVIAVTAVDEQGRVYRRANRGGYIAFAAGGVHVENRYSKASSATVSGTSFAAPRVAAEIASRLAAQPRPEVQQVLDRLHSEAVDLGEAGRDPVYGWGWLR
jgi:minor extracellular protease Epr